MDADPAAGAQYLEYLVLQKRSTVSRSLGLSSVFPNRSNEMTGTRASYGIGDEMCGSTIGLRGGRVCVQVMACERYVSICVQNI